MKGIVLGTFAPLHKGHQYLIDAAIQSVTNVVVVIYDDPSRTSIPLPVRSDWLRILYPGVEVVEAWGAPTKIGYTDEIKRGHEDYLAQLMETENITGVTHFFSSEPYGEHMSQRFDWTNVPVDIPRIRYPIHGTMVREFPYFYRDCVEPYVYKDLIEKVVFLGAPSTGKTTLAKRMAEEWGTQWLPEVGREFWDKWQHNRKLTHSQLLSIAETQLVRELTLGYQSNRFLFVDTNAITTRQFSLEYHRSVSPPLSRIADRCARRYGMVFVCDVDIPYEDTWDRDGDQHRQVAQRKLLAELKMRRIPYKLLQGSLEQRAVTVNRVLMEHLWNCLV